MNSTSLYAAIDLGSNSFHMLVVREVAGSIQTLTRIKRKVRLAAGLNSDNALSAEAMERGWQCLRLFAERLQDIPQPQIRVVATATLRIATNADIFIAKAQEILGCAVQVISGEEEARLIYQGLPTPPAVPISVWSSISAEPVPNWSPALVHKPPPCLACRWAASRGSNGTLPIEIWRRKTLTRQRRRRVKSCVLSLTIYVFTAGKCVSGLLAPYRHCRKS